MCLRELGVSEKAVDCLSDKYLKMLSNAAEATVYSDYFVEEPLNNNFVHVDKNADIIAEVKICLF